MGCCRLRAYLFPLVAVGLLTAFLYAPWPFEHKARAFMHGLCAQRPSHSLRLGRHTLPFDARMTGIYGGFFVTSAYLLVRGRYRAWRLPTRQTLVTLTLFVAVLGIDGTNALLLDLGLWHPYAPDNRYRIASGLLTGVSLGVGICFMLGTTLWRAGRANQAPVSGISEVVAIAALQTPFALLALSGSSTLYVPMTLLLIVSATVVVASLVLVSAVLLRYGDRPFASPQQAQGAAAMALLIGVAVIGAMAAGRFLLERLTGTPPLT